MANPAFLFEGKPCIHGHGTTRWKSTGVCVICYRIYNRRWLKANPRHPLYEKWHDIKRRCENPTRPDYALYGGRGITMYDHWRDNPQTFIADIIALIGMPPSPKHSIDRIDNNGPYAPGNVQWALPGPQNRNRRSTKLTLTDVQLIRTSYQPHIRGNVAALARRFGVSWSLIHNIVHNKRWRET